MSESTAWNRYAQVQVVVMILVLSLLVERQKEVNNPSRPEHQLVMSPQGSFLVWLDSIVISARAATVPIGTGDDSSARSRAAGREESQLVSNRLFVRDSSSAVGSLQMLPSRTEYPAFSSARLKAETEGRDTNISMVDVDDSDTQEDVTSEETSLAADGTREAPRTVVPFSRRCREGEGTDSLSSDTASPVRASMVLPAVLFLLGVGFAAVLGYASSPPFSPLGSALAAAYSLYLGLIAMSLTSPRWADGSLDGAVLGYTAALLLLAYSYGLHARNGLVPYIFLLPPTFFCFVFTWRLRRYHTDWRRRAP